MRCMRVCETKKNQIPNATFWGGYGSKWRSLSKSKCVDTISLFQMCPLLAFLLPEVIATLLLWFLFVFWILSIFYFVCAWCDVVCAFYVVFPSVLFLCFSFPKKSVYVLFLSTSSVLSLIFFFASLRCCFTRIFYFCIFLLAGAVCQCTTVSACVQKQFHNKKEKSKIAKRFAY